MSILVRSIILFIGICIVWQGIVALFILPNYILPNPWQVAVALQQNAYLLLMEAIPTMIETLSGLTLGIAFGCITALLMAYFKPVGFWFLPIMIISQAIPTFAIAPLLVIWFGYGITAKIICAILMIFFPITSAFYDGLQNTPEEWLDLAKIMRASKLRTFLKIRIPAAIPHLISGIKIAVVFAPIGAVIGEWIGSNSGLGFLMLNANARMQIDLMFAALFVLVVFSLVLYGVVYSITTRSAPCHSEAKPKNLL